MSSKGELLSRTLIKPSDVASLLGVSRQTVYLWHDIGKIEGVKLGGSLRIYGSSVARVLSARRTVDDHNDGSSRNEPCE